MPVAVVPRNSIPRNKFYGRNKPRRYVCRAKQLEPRMDRVVPGGVVAVDCEGVILPLETGKARKGLGRVLIVAEDGTPLYDTFAYYPASYQARPHPQRLKLGVKYNDIKPENGAQPFPSSFKTSRPSLMPVASSWGTHSTTRRSS